MAHDTPTYTLREGVHVFGFPGGAVLEIARPRFDQYGRLWAQVAARQGEGLLNRERLDLLDGGMRQRFIDVVLRRDGGGDWDSRLLFALEHTRAAAITDPSVSFGSAPSGASDEWPDPLPLPDPLPPVEPFEPTLLPEVFRPWIGDIAERMQCPPDYPAVAAMVALATVVGRRVGIRPKRRDDWLVVPNLWGGVVGRSGVLKTPAIQEPLRPLWRLEYEAGRAYEQAVTLWQVQQIIADAEKEATKKKIRDAVKKGEDATGLAENFLASQGSSPVRGRFLVNDSTVEKLGELLNQNPLGLLVFRDELTGLLRTLDREGHEGARAFYLEAWNGTGRFVYDRIGRGTIGIEAACVSILGGIQPGPLAHYLRAVFEGGGRR
jgi:hypothetical protein